MAEAAYPRMNPKPSNLVLMSAEEVADKFISTNKMIRVMSIISIILIFALSVSGALGVISVASIAIVAILVLIVILIMSRVRRNSYADLQKVLLSDCDARKLHDALQLIKENSKVTGASRTVLDCTDAICLNYLGKTDEALELAKSIEANPKAKDYHRMISYEVQSDSYRAKRDMESLQELYTKLQAELGKMQPTSNRRAGYESMIDYVDGDMDYLEGKWDAARQLIEDRKSTIVFPAHRIAIEKRMAELGAAQGDDEEAASHYLFINRFGGTLAARDEARAWLGAHGYDQKVIDEMEARHAEELASAREQAKDDADVVADRDESTDEAAVQAAAVDGAASASEGASTGIDAASAVVADAR